MNNKKNMNCRQCKTYLSEYQEGKLSKKIRQEIKKHLKICPVCRKELVILDKLMSLTHNLPRHTPGDNVILNIKSAIYKQSKKERRTEFGQVLDTEELAEFLRVSPEIIKDYIDELPCFELGGKILFRKKSIEEWIERKEMGFGFQLQESEINRILLPQNVIEGGARWKI